MRNEKLNREVGKRLKKCIKESRYKQYEIAEHLDLSDVEMSKKVTGKGTLSEEQAKKIGELLDVSPDFLLCKTDFKNTTYELGYNLFNTLKTEISLFEKVLDFIKEVGIDIKINPVYIKDERNLLELPQEEYEKLMDNILENDFFILKKDGKECTISLREFDDFKTEICDYIEMRIKRIIIKKGE